MPATEAPADLICEVVTVLMATSQGELTDDQRALMEAHIASCPICTDRATHYTPAA